MVVAIKPSTPAGLPKSGRDWKKPQKSRSSSQKRCGVLKHLCKSFEEKRVIREKRDDIKALEKHIADENTSKRLELKRLREERQQRRLANEFKSTSYQAV